MPRLWKSLMIVALIATGCGKGGTKPADGTKAAAEPTKAAADQAYTIKIKKNNEPGVTFTARSLQKNQGSVKISGIKGKDGDNPVDEVKEDEFVETVLEKGDKAPAKYKRTYKKATLTQNGKEIKRPHEGKTLIFEQEGKSYKITVEGGMAVPQAELDKLAKDAANRLDGDGAENFLPDKPVKIEEPWSLNRKGLQELGGKGSEIDLDKSKGEGKLVRVYTKDGKQYGVIDLNVNIVLKDSPPFTYEPPGTVAMKGTLDIVIDGSSAAGKVSLAGKMNGKGTFDIGGGKKGNVEMKFDVHVDAHQGPESQAK